MDPYHHPDTAALIQAALHEDLRFIGDLTCQTLVPRSARLRAAVTAKATGVVCGLPLFDRVLAALGGGEASLRALLQHLPPAQETLRQRTLLALLDNGEIAYLPNGNLALRP